MPRWLVAHLFVWGFMGPHILTSHLPLASRLVHREDWKLGLRHGKRIYLNWSIQSRWFEDPQKIHTEPRSHTQATISGFVNGPLLDVYSLILRPWPARTRQRLPQRDTIWRFSTSLPTLHFLLRQIAAQGRRPRRLDRAMWGQWSQSHCSARAYKLGSKGSWWLVHHPPPWRSRGHLISRWRVNLANQFDVHRYGFWSFLLR